MLSTTVPLGVPTALIEKEHGVWRGVRAADALRQTAARTKSMENIVFDFEVCIVEAVGECKVVCYCGS